jgi:hypothetical protein
MTVATLRIDLFALLDGDRSQFYSGSLLRHEVMFAELPRPGDYLRGLSYGQYGLPDYYQVAYLEHWPRLRAGDESPICWVVCRGKWSDPGSPEERVFAAILEYENQGWTVSLDWEIQKRYQDFLARKESAGDEEIPEQGEP